MYVKLINEKLFLRRVKYSHNFVYKILKYLRKRFKKTFMRKQIYGQIKDSKTLK